MKERPIIFNSEMVRAILDGRKTQTRRVIKPQPTLSERTGFNWNGYAYGIGSSHKDTIRNFANCFKVCPFGQVGDQLWVRETWQLIHSEYDEDEITYAPRIPEQHDSYWQPVYEVDFKGESRETRGFPWRPSIHMPRHACRLVLEITGVRVERLGDISNDDAKAEGVTPAGELLPNIPDAYLTPKGDFATAKVAFQRLWESIYGAESWQANPWVWVIEFRRVKP
ncbi:hypothetical protein FOT80_26600 [Serratia fonticola]|nr:hypothetical protein [Serratia fonticola]